MTRQSVPAKAHSWAGWIPTVSGQLSFSIIGHTSAANHCVYVNEVLPGSDSATPVRYIALHQFRAAHDFPYLHCLTKIFFPGHTFDFICAAQTAEAEIQVILPRNAEGEPRVRAVQNAQGVLEGRVYVLLYEKDKEHRGRNASFIERLKSTLRLANTDNIAQIQSEISGMLSDPRPWLAGADDSSEKQRQTSDAPCDLSQFTSPFLEAKFELYRTGEFRLKIEENDWLKVIPEPAIADALKIIPNQIFYFMKDVVHRHYHHDGSSDQMLALTRLTKAQYENEIDWRRRTLWGLVRVIMQYRRAGFWPDLQKAKGVAAYAEAFQHSFANCIRMQFGPRRFKPTSDLGTYDFKHMRESIEVSIAENTATRNAVWQGAALAVSAIFAVLIAWSSHAGKTMTLRLAACGPQEDKITPFLKGIRGRLGCSDSLADAVTGWEALAAGHPFIVVLLLVVLIWMFAGRYLLDVPVGKSWIGRRWQSIRSTWLLFIFAVHVQLVIDTRDASPIGRFLKKQIPLALLLSLLAAQVFALNCLLRNL